MNTSILNILCEGQTEERFVKDVLKPYFAIHGIVVKSRLLVTSRKKGTRGGMFSYTQAKNDLTRWMKEVEHRGSETHFFTTMFDFYALPDGFPNMVQAAILQRENVQRVRPSAGRRTYSGYADRSPW